MKIKKSLQAAGLRTVYDYVDKDPRARLPQVVSLLEKFVPAGSDMDGVIRGIKEGLADPDNNWNRFVLSLWDDIDAGARRALFENFALNGSFLQSERNDELRRKYNCNIPWTMLIDPTSACNLHCTGCWAAEHGNRLNLSYAELEDILRQGKELGIHFYLFSGGEPLVRKADILRLCQAHPDCEFSAFTNGTLIDEDFCQEMLRVGNFFVSISVEGFEEANDGRRGRGHFQKALDAMDLMRSHRIPFGVSICYTSRNYKVVTSDEFLDLLISKGCVFAWYFHYMPVGLNADTSLLLTPEQRTYMKDRVREIRGVTGGKELYCIDFQNDGEFAGGCVAVGCIYCHTNAAGDVEPCVFIHYSSANIREKSFLECLQQPLFKLYRQGQPFNGNHLRPCPMLENPELLPKMVAESGAHSTDLEAPESAEHLCEKCRAYADCWKPEADRLWGQEHP